MTTIQQAVHNPDQVMAWRAHDVLALIGKHLTIRAAADPSYWRSPHDYDGPWQELHGGVVADATLDLKGESARVTYTDGTWAEWIAGQPVYITVTEPKGE